MAYFSGVQLSNNDAEYTCSECNNQILNPTSAVCPHCGAKAEYMEIQSNEGTMSMGIKGIQKVQHIKVGQTSSDLPILNYPESFKIEDVQNYETTDEQNEYDPGPIGEE